VSISYLVTSPNQSGDKHKHTRNRQESTNKVDTRNDFFPRKTSRVDTGWWVVEYYDHHESDESPEPTPKTDKSPVRVKRDQLSPQDRGAEWKDGEDEHSNIFSTLPRWCKLRGCGQSGQFVDTSTNSRKSHTSLKESVWRTDRVVPRIW
jgi:hypothetical protein